MYVLTKTNNAVVMQIMNMESATSDVNGRKEKLVFCYSSLESDKTHQKKFKTIYVDVHLCATNLVQEQFNFLNISLR